MQVGLSVVMLGATGAVGSRAAETLMAMNDVTALTLLGRRPLTGLSGERVRQHRIDVFNASSYRALLPRHQAAICTLGVGQPSKMSRDDFVRTDKTAVLTFASECKAAGVSHFVILGSVGSSARSRSFYLRTKGELEEGLASLDFERLSVFRPSMILTPTNRYGLAQGLTLAIWPRLRPFLVGVLRKYRGIEVDRLGRAIALCLRVRKPGLEIFHWEAIEDLADRPVDV